MSEISKEMGIGEAVVWLGIFRHGGTMWELREDEAGEIVVRSDDGREMTRGEAINVAKGIVRDRAKALSEKARLKPKRDVFARPECLFNYCPTPNFCRAECASPARPASADQP